MFSARWVRPFLVVWVSAVSLVLVVTALFFLLTREFSPFGILVPLVMLGFGIGMLRHLPRDFVNQTDREVRYLAELIDASRVEWVINADDSPR
jgi:hypothetical protein